MNQDDRDHELDEMLSALRKESPSELQLRRWMKKTRPRFQPAWVSSRMAAALLLGFLLGLAAMHIQRSSEENNFKAFATVEEIYLKSE